MKRHPDKAPFSRVLSNSTGWTEICKIRIRMTAPLRLGRLGVATGVVWAVSIAAAAGQTPRLNSYTLTEEVALGQQAAAVIERRWAPVADPQVHAYVDALGRRLAGSLPTSLRHSGFDYRVVVLNQPEIMSIAVPGGPVVVSRAMIELAPSDAALAGLLAHELSHVALRHATTQISAGDQYELGAISGRVVGEAATSGGIGILDRGAQFAAMTFVLAYDAAHEQQADRLAADMMAQSGYNPHARRAIFLLAARDGALRGGGWWAMRHPSTHRDAEPVAGNAAGRRTADPISRPLAAVQARLRTLPAGDAGSAHRGRLPLGTIGYSVVGPSGESRSTTAGDLLQLTVPANWDRMPTGNTVIFAPQGAYLALSDGATAVTHGLQIGIARSLTGTLHGDVHMLLAAFGRNNPAITWTPAFQDVTIAGRSGITTSVSHVSPVTRAFESVLVSAVQLPDTSLLYVIGVAPQDEASVYRNAFNRVLASIQIPN